jgi:ParB-like nuclease domain
MGELALIYGSTNERNTETPKVAPISVVAVSEMYVDHTYQRPLDERHVDKIVRKYAPELWMPLLVAPMPHGYAVVEGQHRHAAAKRLGIMLLPCVVKHMTQAEQAAWFIRSNESRKRVSRLDKHRALVCAGDSVAMALERAATSAGARIATGNHLAFRCMDTLYYVVSLERKLKHEGLVARAFSMLISAWPTSETARAQDFVRGSVLFYAAYGDDVRDLDVIEKFALVNARKVAADISQTKGSDSSRLGYAAACVFREMYNAKRRNRLEIARLDDMHRHLKGMKPSPETVSVDS